MAIEPGAGIVLVRHGETEWSSSGKHTSYSDVALTEHGREQASALAPRLAAWQFALVLTSPRRRAVDTCGLAGLGDLAEVTDDLAEWDYGEYEGRTTPEIRKSVPHWTIFTHGAPGGETASRVGARADRVLARASASSARGPVALFSHAHFLRVLGARWVGLAPDHGRLFALDVATISVLGHERDQRVLRVWNS
jgi:broad specificity phosphatase PhoE